jgi:hypothetical protein
MNRTTCFHELVVMHPMPRCRRLSPVTQVAFTPAGAGSLHLHPLAFSYAALEHPRVCSVLVLLATMLALSTGAQARPLSETGGRSAMMVEAQATAALPSLSLPQTGSSAPSMLETLMRAGDDAMMRGDVSRARSFYQRATVVDPSSGAACLSMGSTYDPNMLATLDTRGNGLIDVAKARAWYERANQLGHPAASQVLSRLR